MGIIDLLIILVIIGFVVWLVLQVPMPPVMKNVIIGVVALFLVIYLLQTLGLVGHLGNVRIK